jgi:hypothetical protein
VRLSDLRDANVSRAKRHLGYPEDAQWTVADWSNAMCGEAGEAANIVKKIRRHDCGLQGTGDPSKEQLIGMLAEELADIYDIDLGRAIIRKFNAVSRRQGFPERL